MRVKVRDGHGCESCSSSIFHLLQKQHLCSVVIHRQTITAKGASNHKDNAAASVGIDSAAGTFTRAVPLRAPHCLRKQAYQTCILGNPKQLKAPREQTPKCAQNEAISSLLFFVIQTMAPHQTSNTCPRSIARNSNPYIQSPCHRALAPIFQCR